MNLLNQIKKFLKSDKNNGLQGTILLVGGISIVYLLLPLISWLLEGTSPALSSGLSFLWFMLPGMLITIAFHQDSKWWERIPLSFVLSIALITPLAVVAILMHLSLDNLVLFHFITLMIAGAIVAIARSRRSKQPDISPASGGATSLKRIDKTLLFLLVVLIIIVSILAYLALLWPMTGDDVAGMSIFAEVLSQNRITGTEPFHGSGVPVTPRNEMIVATYMEILINRISGLTSSEFLLIGRMILVLLAVLSLATLLNQLLKDKRLILFLLCIWGIYLLATTQEDGTGSDFITRIIQDKFLGWFIIVPMVVVFMLWFLENRNLRILIEFIFVTLAAALIHPITLIQVMILVGGFGIIHFLVERNRQAFLLLFIVASVLLFTATIPFIQYLRYTSYMPVELAGLGDAVEFGRLSAAVTRYRLWLLPNDRFILHPAVILQPPILIAYLLLPWIILKMRNHKMLQLMVGVMLIMPIMLYLPPFAALVGFVVTPYLIWRLAWPLPLFAILIIGYTVWSMVRFIENRITSPRFHPIVSGLLLPVLILVALWIAVPDINASVRDYIERRAEVEFSSCVKAENVMAYLEQHSIDHPIDVLSSHDLNFCMPGYVANANVVEYRGYGTVNRLSVDDIEDSLKRVEDVFYFDTAKLVDERVMSTIQDRNIDYVLVDKDKLSLDLQFNLMPDNFRRVYEDEDFRLYQVENVAGASQIVSGNSALRAKDYQTARDIFQGVLDQEPGNTLAYVGLGLSEDGLGNSQEAIHAYQEAIHRAPNEPALHAQLASTYLVMRDFENALQEYEQAIALSPQRSSLHTALGDLFILLNRKEDARKNYEQAAALQSGEGTAAYYSLLGRSLQYIDQMKDDALNYHQKAISIQNDPQRMIDLARAYASAGDLEKSLEILQQTIAMDRWNYLPHLELGYIYIKENRIDEAIKELLIACRLNPANVSAYISLAMAIKDQNGLEAAAAQLEEMQKLNRILPGPYRGYAVLMATYGNLEEALKTLDISENIQPRSGAVLTTKGYISMIAEHMDAAFDSFNEALLNYPDLIAAQLGLGMYYKYEANFSMETSQLLQIARLVPTASWIHSALAETYANQGEWQAALDESDWAVKLDPGNAEGYQVRGSIYAEQLKWDEAISNYSKACELAPDDIETWMGLGDIYRNLADYPRAESLYQRAAEINPESVDPKIRLANMYWQLGRTEEVVSLEESIAKMAPDSNLVLLRTANSYKMQGKSGEATSAYYDVIEDYPETISAYIALASLLEESDNDINVLFSIYKDMLIANPGSAEAYLASGRFYQAQGEQDVSEAIYTRSLALPNVTIDNYLALSELQRKRGDVQAALKTLEDATQVFPGVAIGFSSLGEYKLNLGQTDQAEEFFDKALAIDPALVSAYAGKAQIERIRGNNPAAEKILQEAITKDPGSQEALLALAEFQESTGRSDNAEGTIQKALAINPLDVDTNQAAALFYMRQGRYEDALQILQSALSLPEEHLEVYLLLGNLEMARKDTAQALRWYQAANNLDRSDARPYLALADLYKASGEYEQASHALGEALLVEPTNVDVNLAMGEFARWFGNRSDARHYFERARKLDRSNINPLLSLAELSLDLGNTDEAKAYLEEAIHLQATNFVVYDNLARVYQLTGDYGKAQTTIMQGLKNISEKQAAYLALAALNEAHGFWDVALDNYKYAWEQVPVSKAVGLDLVKYLARREQDDMALELLSQLQARFGDDAEIYTVYGDILNTQAKWPEAIEAYQRAIELDPGAKEAYSSLVDIYEEQGNLQGAVDLIQTGLETSNDVDLQISLGLALRRQGKHQEALEAFQRALYLSPFNSVSMINMEQLNKILGEPQIDLLSYVQRALIAPSPTTFSTIAQIYQARGQWKNAYSWYQRAIMLDPLNSENWFNLGSYYQLLGESDSALEAYNQALKFSPSSAETILAIGYVQEEQGLTDEARKSYQHSIEMNPGELDGYLALAQLEMGNGQTEEALQTIQEGIQHAPGDYRGYSALGDMYATIDAQDISGIEAAYQAGLDLLPGESALYVRLGELHANSVFSAWLKLKTAEENAKLSANRYAALLDHYGIDGNDLSQQTRFIQDTLGEARNTRDRYQQEALNARYAFGQTDADLVLANTYYQKALAQEQSNGSALLGLGRLQLMQDMKDEAVNYFEQASALNPASPSLLTQLGSLYLDIGWTNQAVQVFEQLRKLDPGNLMAQAGLLEGYQNLDQISISQAANSVEQGAYKLDSLVDFLRTQEVHKRR